MNWLAALGYAGAAYYGYQAHTTWSQLAQKQLPEPNLNRDPRLIATCEPDFGTYRQGARQAYAALGFALAATALLAVDART